MIKVAIIEKTMSSTNYDKYFDFEYDRFALCSDSSKQKILKRDVDIEIETDSYDWLILVGSEPFKNFTRKTSITEYNGKIVDVVSKGSSLKFCLVAEGLANVYPRFAPTMEWDTAAGQAICNAVGIDVISKETNESLSYNKEILLNPSFLVSK